MFRFSALYRASFLTLALALLCASAFAGGPVFWEVSKQEDIVRGDASGVSIADNGTILLAPTFGLVYDTKEAYIWSSASDAAGNLYLGTGHEGRVFKVEPSGTGRMIYDAGELDVTALATDAQGNLYAGTSPDGRIYKITPGGQASTFYDPPDKYIWSLAFDQAASALYAGTGDKGVIYRIDSAGKASVLADTNEINIVSLAVDRSSNVIAGTDPSGLVLRVSPQGKVFALFDSPMQEIHSLVMGSDGSVFALGINQQATAQRQGNIGVSSSTSISSEGVITISTGDDQEGAVSSVSDLSGLLSQSQSRTRSSRAEGAKTAVFRILPDGGSEIYWSTRELTGFALRPLDNGGVLVGTGSKGRIYNIARDRSDTLLVQSPEDQTSTIIAVGDRLYATSSNLGRLYRIGSQTMGEGSYVSPVHDTKFAGQWGVITWRGTGNIELQTRSGNTESPDATWSDWSAPYRNAAGDQVTSPRARFIQWRATLRGAPRANASAATAQLQSVVIAYLPRNQAPEVSSVTVLPPGVALQEVPLAVDPSIAASGLDPQVFGVTMNVPPRRFFQKGARSLTWQGADANDDTLVYKIFYRAIGDGEWHLLADNISQAYYTIDGNRLPDGAYQFKVQASDAASNPAGLALENEAMTDAVELDNSPPSVKVNGPVMAGRSVEVTFEVSDITSRVVRGEYSVDGGQWQLLFPVDGISDSARESFTLKLSFDRAGEHVIAFRCADSSGNVGTSKVTAQAR